MPVSRPRLSFDAVTTTYPKDGSSAPQTDGTTCAGNALFVCAEDGRVEGRVRRAARVWEGDASLPSSQLLLLLLFVVIVVIVVVDDDDDIDFTACTTKDTRERETERYREREGGSKAKQQPHTCPEGAHVFEKKPSAKTATTARLMKNEMSSASVDSMAKYLLASQMRGLEERSTWVGKKRKSS